MAGAAAAVEEKVKTVRLWSKYPSLVLRNIIKPEFRLVINEHGHEKRSTTTKEGFIQFIDGVADVDPQYAPIIKRMEGYDRDFWFLDELRLAHKDPKTRKTAEGRCKERHRAMALAAEKGREESVPSELDMIKELMA